MSNKLIRYDQYMGNKSNKYSGIFIREIKNNDISFVIRYRKGNESKDICVGKKSDGMTVVKAKKFLDDILSAIRNGINESQIIKKRDSKSSRMIVNPSDLEKMSLNALAEIYFNTMETNAKKEINLEKSEKTCKDYFGINKEKSLYKNFWKYWEKSYIPFHKVTMEDFIDQIKNLRNLVKEEKKVNSDSFEFISVPKYSGKYITNAITLVKSIINHTNCPHNPLYISQKNEQAVNIKSENELKALYSILKKNNTKDSAPRENSFLEPEEIKLFLKTLRSKNIYYQGYLMSLILFSTGMRPDSCLNLKIKDINFGTRKITTYDFKRKMNYKCFLLENVELELLSFIGNRDKNEYLFFSNNTKRVKKLPNLPEYIAKTMNTLFNKNRFGNDRIVPYSMRHTFATNLARGIKDKEGKYIVFPKPLLHISKLLNHANVETTERNYAHCTIEDSMDSVTAYGGVLSIS